MQNATVNQRCGGILLRPVNENFFYQFGAVLRPVIEMPHPVKLGEAFRVVYPAQGWVEWFLKDKVVPLSVCKGSGYKLLDAIKEIVSINQREDTKADDELEFLNYYAVTNAAKEFETVFTAELQTVDTYLISQTGIYKTSDLIEHAERIFPESVLATIPDHAVKDIRDCGKCLAFDLPTSAGFHMLRATEALIREYMTVVVGTPPKLKSRNWGRYLDILKKHGADPRILAALDQIREMHRNPIMHPEDFLSAEEASTLLGVAQGVVVFIAADIAKRKAAKEAEKAAKAKTALGTPSALAVGLKRPLKSLAAASSSPTAEVQ